MLATSLLFYVHLGISFFALFQSSFSCLVSGLPCVTFHCSSQSATLSEGSNTGQRTMTRWLRKDYSSEILENIQDPFKAEKNADKLEVNSEYLSSRNPHGRTRKSMRKGSCKFNCSVTTFNTKKIRLGKTHETITTTKQNIGKFKTFYARNMRSHFMNTYGTSRRSEQKLQTIQTVLVVSKDGRPDHFPSIQSAVDAVPMWNYVEWIIYIEPGWYREAVVVPQGKDYITFLGGGAENTVIVNNRNASAIGPNGAQYGILDCATVIIEGSHFTAKGITFMNESPKPSAEDFNSQAPAIRISGDECAFYSCTFIGWQDTLFADQGKQYYKNCKIEGSVDFILGYAKAVFDNCTIHSRDQGFISAQSRWCQSGCIAASSAFIFLKCNLTGTGPTYLGRPWKPYAKVIFIDTYMSSHILPEGWIDWMTKLGPLFPHENVFFAEFGSSGPRSNPNTRVSWSHQLNETDITDYRDWTSFLEGEAWLDDPPNLQEILDSNLLSDSWSQPTSADESEPLRYLQRRWKNLGSGQSDP